MPRLIWSPAALRDVARPREFLAGKNPDAARRAVATIRHGVRLLGVHPEVGRPVEELSPEFREWPIGFGSTLYVVLYRADDGGAVILSVRHGREVGYSSFANQARTMRGPAPESTLAEAASPGSDATRHRTISSPPLPANTASKK